MNVFVVPFKNLNLYLSEIWSINGVRYNVYQFGAECVEWLRAPPIDLAAKKVMECLPVH